MYFDASLPDIKAALFSDYAKEFHAYRIELDEHMQKLRAQGWKIMQAVMDEDKPVKLYTLRRAKR